MDVSSHVERYKAGLFGNINSFYFMSPHICYRPFISNKLYNKKELFQIYVLGSTFLSFTPIEQTHFKWKSSAVINTDRQ